MPNRYSTSRTLRARNSNIIMFQNIKYPEITRVVSDIYLYTTRGDRYDTLAQSFYGDSSYWWVIAMANVDISSPDSLIPEIGAQIRVPSNSRLPNIVAEFEELNKYTN